MTPASGSTRLAPNLSEIRVVFDSPMTDQSWSVVGSGPNYPKLTGRVHYDAARTTFIAPFQLVSMAVSRADQLEAGRRYAETFAVPESMRFHTHQNHLGENQRIRVGFLSSDFFEHATASHATWSSNARVCPASWPPSGSTVNQRPSTAS